jgi:hypothetical protein
MNRKHREKGEKIKRRKGKQEASFLFFAFTFSLSPFPLKFDAALVHFRRILYRRRSSWLFSKTPSKVPPQSLDAEESVLGGILLDHSLDRVIELMSEEDFYRETHRKIFRSMVALSERNEPIDLITLTDTLKAKETCSRSVERRIG